MPNTFWHAENRKCEHINLQQPELAVVESTVERQNRI